jgi:replicative DNA helicase
MATEEKFCDDDFADMPKLLSEVVEHIKARMKNPNGLTGISTGFEDLDRFTFGMQRGNLIVVAGRPSMGESILTLNIAEHVALIDRLPVAIFDMDRGMMNPTMLLLASYAKINYHDLRHGEIDNEQSERLSHAADVLKDAPIHISTNAAVSVQEVGERLRKLNKSTDGLGLVIVDCLPELKLTGEMADKKSAHEIAMISRHLKTLAKELDVPIVVLSPINRDLEERINKSPRLVDLPYGGAIASAADLVVFVYRDSVYDCESADQGMAEIIVAKNTNGSVGSFLLKYNEKYPRFEEFRPD